MKKLTLSLIMAFCTMGLFAQELANFNFGRVNVVSPEIGEQSVIFRIQAPQAQNVQVALSWQEQPVSMTKNQQGVWEVSVPRPAAELYTYNFVVDGVKVNDANNIFMQRDGTTFLSVLLIPGELTENYFEANKRGDLHQVWYESPTLGMERRMFVYTPHGYNDMKDPLPVLYLLHGAGGDEDAWSNMGRTCQIMDNLIEKGQAKPMIVVMPNGNPTQYAARTLQIPEKQQDRNDPNFANAYVTSIVKDMVPYMEKNYNVIKNPDGRAIAGLSMGAGHTISCTNLFPGFFKYICPLSNGIRVNDQNKDEYNKQFQALKKAGIKLYWIGCGETDFLIESARQLDATLTENGIEHTFYENSGGHTWSNWRIYLNQFAPLLFK